MTEDLVSVLTKFHREIVLPDMQRSIREAMGELREEINTKLDGHLDAIYKRFDRLETEYHMIVVGLKRLEERMDALEHRMDRVESQMDKLGQRMDRVEEGLERVEQRLDKVALRSELLDLKTRVDVLQEQVRTLEARLEE